MSRTRRSVLSLLSGSAGSIVAAILAIVTTPLLVNWLGDAAFGAYRACLDWFAYVGLLEFGIGGAMLPLFVQAIATKDRGRLVALIRAGLRAFFQVALMMFVLGLALAYVMPWLINAPVEWHQPIRLGGLWVCLGCLLLPFNVFRPYVEAMQRGVWVNLLLLLQSLMLTSLSLFLAFAAFGVSGQLAAYALGTAVFPLAIGWFGLRAFPELWRSSLQPIPTQEVWRMSWPTFGFNLCSRVALFTDNIILAALYGPQVVAPFFLTQRVIALAGVQVQGIANSTWAGLIEYYLAGEVEFFHHRLLQTTRFALLAGFALIMPVAVWNAVLIECWVGAPRYGGSAITWLCAVNTLLLCGFTVLGWPLMALGKVREVLAWAVWIAALNFTSSVTLAWLVGPPGPLWGSLIALVGLNIPATLSLLRRHVQLSPRQLIRAIWPALFVGGLFTLLLILTQPYLPVPSSEASRWWRLVAVGGWLVLSAGVFAPLAWFFGLPASDRQEWGSRLRLTMLGQK